MKNNIEILTNILTDIFGKDLQLLIPSITPTISWNIQRSIFFIENHIIEALLCECDRKNYGILNYTEDKNNYYMIFGVYRVCYVCRNLFLTDFYSKKEFDGVVNEEYPRCNNC